VQSELQGCEGMESLSGVSVVESVAVSVVESVAVSVVESVAVSVFTSILKERVTFVN
jgi:hypothetical protein